MSHELSRRRLRLWLNPADILEDNELKDYDRAREPLLIKGNAIYLEAAVFDAPDALADLSGVTSIIATFKASQTSDATALASKTVDAADFGSGFTIDNFKSAAANAWHARFAFSDDEMTWDLGGEKTLDAWLVITAILSDGSERTLAFGPVTMIEDNNSTEGGVLPAAIFTVENNRILVLCQDGETRWMPLLNDP